MSKFAEASKTGQTYTAQIHAAGCKDLAKLAHQGFEVYPVEVATFAEWAQIEFGDCSSDYEETGSIAWERECLANASEVRVLPCAQAAGFTR
jgi:hypothetical protein